MAATRKKTAEGKVAKRTVKTKTVRKSTAKKAAPKKKAVTAKKTASAKKKVAAPKKSTSAKKPSPAKKSVSAKKAAVKKTTAKKAAPKKAVSKKAAPRKTASKKTVPKKTTPRKKKADAATSSPSKAKVRASRTKLTRLAHKPVVMPPDKPTTRKKLTAREKDALRKNLVTMRAHYSQQVENLKNGSLFRHDSVNSTEDGTDAFDRQFALSIAGSEQESLAATVNALIRLEEGTYGVCEECGCIIGLSRLKALPFVPLCITCKAGTEQGRPRPKMF